MGHELCRSVHFLAETLDTAQKMLTLQVSYAQHIPRQLGTGWAAETKNSNPVRVAISRLVSVWRP
jgi:hypothetical protein